VSDNYANRDAARAIAAGNAPEFARRYVGHVASQLAEAAAQAALAGMIAEGVAADLALPLCAAVQAEVMSKLGAHPPARQKTSATVADVSKPKLTLIHRKPKA